MSISNIIHRIRPANLPTGPGKYPVQADFVRNREASGGGPARTVWTSRLPATLTLSERPLPEQLRAVPMLAQLRVIEAAIVADTDAKLAQANLYVPEEALLRALWQTHKVNLTALRAFLAAIRHRPGLIAAAMDEGHHEAANKAFGHRAKPAALAQLNPLPELHSAEEPRKKTDTLPVFDEPTAAYIPLEDAYYLSAYLTLPTTHKGLPAPDCWIAFADDAERAEVFFGDTWHPEAEHAAPLDAKQLASDKRTADRLNELFRLRQEQARAREERAQLHEAIVSVVLDKKASGEMQQAVVPDRVGNAHVFIAPETESAAYKKLREKDRSLLQQDLDLQKRLAELYLGLTKWAERQKEPILKAKREHSQLAIQVAQEREALRARDFVQLASNMEGLPAHFAAIPSGIADGLDLASDQFGRAVLKVSRPPLKVDGQPVREHPTIALELPTPTGEQTALLEQVKLILGEHGPRWLVPQGMVAVSKLYRDGGGYMRPEVSYRLYLNDWIDIMRPDQVARFKVKGRGEAFGRGRPPKDFFNALLRVLSALRYEWSSEKGKIDVIDGFFVILGHGTDASGYYVDIMLNPKQLQLISGERPMFMVTNADAMLRHPAQSLEYTPAAQLGLELLARENLFRRPDTAVLADPQGGGITRLALASRFGIIKGPQDAPKDLLRRFHTILDNLGKADVIADWKVDGRDKKGADAFGVKLLITMHDDYRKAYNVARKERTLGELNRQLEAPFAPVKRRRGRPSKA